MVASVAVTTLAGSGSPGFQDGTGAAARFNNPYGIAIDPSGTYGLVADKHNQRIRRVAVASGEVTTLAGGGGTGENGGGYQDGTGASARFSDPSGICIDPSGTYGLVADTYSNRVRRVVLTPCMPSRLSLPHPCGVLCH